jgi:hypothetical protein
VRHISEGTEKGEWITQSPACGAESKPKLRAERSKADFATDWKPESQGQAATPGRELRRNKPCRNGRNGRRERHRPPMLASGQGASPPATGCKQWPVSFSRFEYQPTLRKKLNHFWLLLVNFWHIIPVTDEIACCQNSDCGAHAIWNRLLLCPSAAQRSTTRLESVA